MSTTPEVGDTIGFKEQGKNLFGMVMAGGDPLSVRVAAKKPGQPPMTHSVPLANVAMRFAKS